MYQGASRAKCNAVGPRLDRGVRPRPAREEQVSFRRCGTAKQKVFGVFVGEAGSRPSTSAAPVIARLSRQGQRCAARRGQLAVLQTGPGAGLPGGAEAESALSD